MTEQLYPDEIRRRLSTLRARRRDTDHLLGEVAEMVDQAHDEAYGLRRAGEPVPTSAPGQVADPTGAAPSRVQARQRAALRSIAERAAGDLLESERDLGVLARRWRRSLRGDDEERGGGRPGPPTVVDEDEIAEARDAQRRRHERGER